MMTIKCHLEKYNEKLAIELQNNIYVDNTIVGANEESEIGEIYARQKQIFKEAGFNIRQFASNSVSEIMKLPEKDRGNCENSKLLGIKWYAKEDKFSFKLPIWKDQPVTKRNILKFSAKIFDPMGIICPITLKIKNFRQKVNELKELGWDGIVDEKMQKEFFDLIIDWKQAEFFDSA